MFRVTVFAVATLSLLATLEADDVVYLDQGWTDDERQEYYYQPQGSELIPYSWFMALEQPHIKKLFRDDAHLGRFRFTLNPQNEHNPDGLPIGFVKGHEGEDGPWMGLTCAACHTGQLTYQGTTVRIDGGTTLADMIAFQRKMADALRATVDRDAKFRRFAKQVLGADNSRRSVTQLRRRARRHLVSMANWTATSRPAHPTGFGTWDAVSVLLNTITASSIGAPQNYRTPWVPVSYPSIWLSSEADHLLWNCSVQNPMLRQVGEVIIVFGSASVTPEGQGFRFDSSADLEALRSIYYTTEKLQPPAWPGEVLGAIDAAKASRGAMIYEREQCAKCHANKPPYPSTEPDEWGKRRVKIMPTPIAEVGTDPNYAINFVSRVATPGMLAPAFRGTFFEGQRQIPAAILFLTILQQITNAEIDRMNLSEEDERKMKYRMPAGLPGNEEELNQLVQSLLVYKAGPLAGIWSTAPYLHNGSVPSLYQLLLPPERRVKKFYLGNQEFDPKHVGSRVERFPRGYEFDTSLPGFSNAGHTYGTDITDDERWELLEYLKTL